MVEAMEIPTPVVIEDYPKDNPEGYRATWFDSHVGMAVFGSPGATHQEALRNLADALDGEASRRETIAALDAAP